MFGLKGRDVFNKPKSNVDKLLSLVYKKWHLAIPYVFGVLVIAGIGIVSYTWHKYLYQRNVSETEINQYIIVQNRDFVFNKERFDDLRDIIRIRQEQHDAEKVNYIDPFYRNNALSEEE